MALDRNGDRLIDIGELRELLRQYSSVVSISDSDAQTIMDMCSQPDSQMLQFSEFHNIFCAVQICAQLQHEDMLHLRMRDVKERLVAAGINPTQTQVESMFLLGDAYQTYGGENDKIERMRMREMFRLQRPRASFLFALLTDPPLVCLCCRCNRLQISPVPSSS